MKKFVSNMLNQKLIDQVTLVLHFDLNKSIIIKDSGKGLQTDQMLNAVVSDCVWGHVTDEVNVQGHSWNLKIVEPKFATPQHEIPLVTFGDYIDQHKGLKDCEWKHYKHSFTETGHAGEACRDSYKLLKRSLSFCYSKNDSSRETVEGFHGIVPSFFHMLIELVECNAKFHIIFRTYGSDLSEVANELNLFCEGKHSQWPNVPKMDGTSGSIDRRLMLPTYSGSMKRFGSGEDGVMFAYVDQNKNVNLVRGAESAWSVVEGWMQAGAHTMAIQDDYEWWRDHNESNTSGKLLLLGEPPVPSPRTRRRMRTSSDLGVADTDSDLIPSRLASEVPLKAMADGGSIGTSSSSKSRHLVQILFDDNVERDRAHIADARDRRTFRPIPFSQTQGRNLRRVEPFLAITDAAYFVKEINDALLLFENDRLASDESRRSRAEKGRKRKGQS